MFFLLSSSPILNAYFQADFFGKMIFFILFILSISSWIILIHKIWLSKKHKKLNSDFEKKINANRDNLLNIGISSNIAYPYHKIYKGLKEKTLEILNKNSFFIDKILKS